MSIRSICAILVMSAVFTIPAFGQNIYLDENNFLVIEQTPYGQTQSYDTQSEADRMLRELQEETRRRIDYDRSRYRSQECGFFWQGNQQAMDECIQRNY